MEHIISIVKEFPDQKESIVTQNVLREEMESLQILFDLMIQLFNLQDLLNKMMITSLLFIIGFLITREFLMK
jgi:hypothetical protein